MGAATTSILMEPRWILILSDHFALSIFQTLLVTGGWVNEDYHSSTELLVGTASAWAFAGNLPTPRENLHGDNIDNKILMTGQF